MLNRIGALALLALSSSLVACSSPSSTPPAPTVDGQVVRGALALSSYSLDNAVVIARTADGRSFFAPVLANGTFAVTIPAGASARLSIANSTRKNGYVTVSRILWPGAHKTWARLDGTTASIALGNVHPARLNGTQIQDHGGSYGSGSSGSGSSGSGSGGYTTGGSGSSGSSGGSGSGGGDNGSDQGGSGGGYSTGGSDGNHGGGGDDNGSNDHGGHGSHACGASSSGSSCVEADDCESDGTPVCSGAGEYDSECDGGSYATSDDDDHGSDVACGDGGGGSGSSHESGDDDSSGSGGSYESGNDDNGGNNSGNNGGGYTTGGSDNGGGADAGSGGNANGGSANNGGSAGGNTTGHAGSVPNGGSCTVCAECLSGLVCVASKCATRLP